MYVFDDEIARHLRQTNISRQHLHLKGNYIYQQKYF